VVELRRKGEPAKVVGGIGVGPIRDRTTEVYVDLDPMGESWEKAKRFRSAVQITGGGALGGGENPFAGMGVASGDAARQSDGSSVLMTGSKSKAVWPHEQFNDAALVLVLKPHT
jgi:hypothetical protein